MSGAQKVFFETQKKLDIVVPIVFLLGLKKYYFAAQYRSIILGSKKLLSGAHWGLKNYLAGVQKLFYWGP